MPLAVVAFAVLTELAGATAPLSAQGILGPTKASKAVLPSAVEMADPALLHAGRVLEDLFGDGIRQHEGMADALVAVLHEPLKAAGPHSFGQEGSVVLKRALVQAERRVRTVVAWLEAGEASEGEALAELRDAFREYLDVLDAASVK